MAPEAEGVTRQSDYQREGATRQACDADSGRGDKARRRIWGEVTGQAGDSASGGGGKTGG